MGQAEEVQQLATTPAPPASREQLRSQRPWAVKARSVDRRMSSAALAQLRAEEAARELAEPVHDVPRPRTRAECVDGPRPCPWVGCRHHLFLEVAPNGSIKLNRPELEPGELPASCSLDFEDQALRREQVGALLNLTRERVRQIENKARARARAAALERGVEGAFMEEPLRAPARRLPVIG